MNNQIEKLAEEYAEANVSYGNAKSAVKQITDGYQAGAAALLELIRERMPGYQHPLGPLSRENKGYNNAIEDVVKLLDTIK